MKKKLWIAGILLVAGALVAFAALAMAGFDFNAFAAKNALPVSEIITESFTDISLELDSCDVAFQISTDGSCKIVGSTTEKQPVTATVENGVLVIKQIDLRKWYDYIGIWNGDYKLTVYLPDIFYNQLSITADTSDITVPDKLIFTGDVTIAVSTGDVDYGAPMQNLTITTSTGDITVQNLLTEGIISLCASTGDINLSNVTCGQLTVKTDTGDVTLTASDGQLIDIKTDTGDVSGSLLTEKIFIVDNDTGKVIVPETTSGGQCKITSDTGDIIITIE